MLDDQYSIIENPDIRDPSNIPKIFREGFFGDRSYYRPLVSLTYMLEYRAHGLNPFFFNLDNLLLHLANATIIFWIMRLLFISQTASFLISLLFAIHPVQWEPVSNIADRAILLCGFFMIAAFYTFCLFNKNGRKLFYILSVVFFGFSLFSKESAVVFPLLIFTFNRWMGKKPLGESAKIAFPFFAVLIFYAGIRKFLGIASIFYWNSPREMILGVLTFLRGVITYLKLFIFPIGLHFDRSRMLFTKFSDIELILTVIFFVCLVISFIFFRRRWGNPVIFFTAWFFINLLPVAQIFPIYLQFRYISLAEHFLYIPSIGIFTCLVLLCEKLYRESLQRKLFSKEALQSIIFVFLLFFFTVSVEQNIYAGDKLAMFERSLRYNPRNLRVQSALGVLYAHHGFFKEAERHFRDALDIDPSDARARIGLGKSLIDQGKYFDGMEEYEKVSNAGRWQDLLETNSRLVYGLLIGQYEKAILKTPDDPVLHFSLAVFYSKVHKSEAAIQEYEKAIALNPRYKNALFNLAVIYRSKEEAAQALSYYEKALALETNDALDFPAAFDAGLIYEAMGKKEDAWRSFERSLKIYPGSKEAQQKLLDLSQNPSREP